LAKERPTRPKSIPAQGFFEDDQRSRHKGQKKNRFKEGGPTKPPGNTEGTLNAPSLEALRGEKMGPENWDGGVKGDLVIEAKTHKRFLLGEKNWQTGDALGAEVPGAVEASIQAPCGSWDAQPTD